MRLIGVAFAVLFWWYGTSTAVFIGGVWQSQAYPTPGVAITFLDESRPIERGTLSRNWSGKSVLTRADGTDVVFDLDQVVAEFPPPHDGHGALWYWRAALPFLAVQALAAFLILRSLSSGGLGSRLPQPT